MMTSLIIRLLGDPALAFQGQPLKLPSRSRCLTLLATLALRRSEPVSRGTLASALWPDELEADARANLRRHLHLLQQALPQLEGVEWILLNGQRLAWNDAAPAWIDVRAFEDAVPHAHRRAEAIELYRGELLQGIFEESIFAERDRLQGLYLDACFEAAHAARRDLQFRDAIDYADRILAADEWREDALRLAMLLRHESGDRSSALALFEQFANRLDEEMGIAPMPETMALREALLSGAPLARNGQSDLPMPDRRQPARLPFVGRQHEMASLQAAWRHAAGGRGTLLFVGGEAGIGKSRLISEFASDVAAQGGRVLIGETSNPQAYPYEPIVDALRRGITLILESPPPAPWLQIVSELLPEVRAAFSDLASIESVDQHKGAERLFEGLVRTIQRLASARPLLLVLEDLHWSHGGTLEALETMARRIAAMPALIVATYRSHEAAPAHPLVALRRQLQTQRLASQIDVRPLSDDDMAQLVTKSRPPAETTDSLVSAICSASDGNPLFAGILLRNYADGGVLPDARNACADVAQVILQRVDLLQPEALTLARIASVAGRSFSIELLAKALGWRESEALDALGHLLDRGIVRTSGSSATIYAFSHALLEATIYDSIVPKDRSRLHRRIAATLERIGGYDRDELASIARHWHLAGDEARAKDLYLAAARVALDVHARSYAVGQARAALALETDLRARFWILEIIVQHHASVDEWDRDLELMESLAAQLGDVERYVALRARQAYCSQTGNREREELLIGRMLEMAERTGSKAHMSETLEALGTLRVGLGDFREAVRQYRCALGVEELRPDRRRSLRIRRHLVHTLSRSGDRDAAAAELKRLHEACTGDLTMEDRLELLWAENAVAMACENGSEVARIGASILEIAKRLGDQETEAKAHWLLGSANMNLGEVEAARREYAEAASLFERIAQPQSLAATYINLGAHYVETGLLDRSIDYSRRGAELAERTGARSNVAVACTNLSEAYNLRGDVGEALRVARRGVELAEPTGEQGALAGCLNVLGNAERAVGDFDSALEHLRSAVQIRRERGARESLVGDLAAVIATLRDAGRLDETAEPKAELDALLESVRLRGTHTFAFAVLVTLMRDFGDVAAAQRYAERGRALLEAQLARLPDDDSRQALRALRHNRLLAIP